MPTNIAPPKLASEGVAAGDVATQANVALQAANQAMRAGAGTAVGIQTLTGDAFVSSTTSIVRADTTGGGITATLPSISEYTRNMFYAFDDSASGNIFTLAARGADSINGGASIAVVKMVMVFPVTSSAWKAIVIEV